MFNIKIYHKCYIIRTFSIFDLVDFQLLVVNY